MTTITGRADTITTQSTGDSLGSGRGASRPTLAALPTEWTSQAVVLRTTHLTCRCGARFARHDAFLQQTTTLRTMGQWTTATRSIPLDATSQWELHLPYQHIIETSSLPFCPGCFAGLRPEAPPPPLSSTEWAQTLRRKALGALRAPTPHRTAPSSPTLTELADKLGL